MNDRERLKFRMNSALTYASSNPSINDEVACGDEPAEMHERIMKRDGMTFCHVSRYFIEVEYLSFVTTMEEVEETVRGVFSWATKQTALFPFVVDRLPMLERCH